jgi:hypothetical protein
MRAARAELRRTERVNQKPTRRKWSDGFARHERRPSRRRLRAGIHFESGCCRCRDVGDSLGGSEQRPPDERLLCGRSSAHTKNMSASERPPTTTTSVG